MNALFLEGYIKISILIALADGILAIKSILKNKATGRYLGFACAGAAVVDISYLISIYRSMAAKLLRKSRAAIPPATISTRVIRPPMQ